MQDANNRKIKGKQQNKKNSIPYIIITIIFTLNGAKN